MPFFITRICLFFGLLAPVFVFAQDKPADFFRLDENDLNDFRDSSAGQVIAASRTLKNIEDLPVTVYIITRDEILGNGYITLVDALGSLPGIRVSQPGSAADGETFLVRGIFGNYYCKILLDGIEINPSVTGGMPIGAQLPVRQAERIEVIFGPASSVYGGEALAGVINIVTHQSDRPVTAQADIAMGSDRQEYLNVTIGGKLGKNKNVVSYSLFGANAFQRDMNVKYDRSYLYNPSLYDSSGSYLDKPFYSGDSTSVVMSRLPQSSRLLGISFRWRGWSARAAVMSRTAQSSIGRDPSVFRYNDPQNAWSETIGRYDLTYENNWKKLGTITSLSWLHYRMDELSGFGMAEMNSPDGTAYKYAASDDLLFSEQLTYLPVTGLELTAGLLYQYSGNLPLTNDLSAPFDPGEYEMFSEQDIDDTSVFNGFGFNPITFHRSGLYLQFFYQTGKFGIFGGFRTEYHSLSGFSHNPRIALIYRAQKHLSLRASFSTGNRVPSSHYMYNSSARLSEAGIFYQVVPDTDLGSEKMIAAEAGIRWNQFEWLRLDAAVFYHRIFDQFTRSFILLDSNDYPLAVNPGWIAGAYVNDERSHAELIGLQAELNFMNIIKPVRLDADLNLTLSKGRENLPNDLGTIDDYRQMPVFMGQLNFSFWPHERIRLFIRNYFSSGWVRGYLPLDPDFLRQIGYPVDISGYYRLDLHGRFLITRNFEAFARFNNITNTHYGGIDAYADEYDLFYNPQYGFDFRVGLTFRME
jgi:hemoglobin/transferrin/lactoferrin receptor protein